MDWLLEPFALGFQQRALIGGLISAVMASVVGVWLVLRGMSFFGDAFAHGILPGIAIALILDVSPGIGAAVSVIVMVAAVEWVHRATPLHEDTGIGLLFVAMMALGVVIISTSDTYTGSLTGILFGDALGVTREILVGMIVPAILVVLASIVLYRPLLALSFSRAKAQALGMHPRIIHALLLVLIASSVIVGFRSVGTMLVFGLLIGPPATASLLSRTVGQMFAWSLLIAVLSVFTGLLLSYHLGTAGSATMALVPIVLFFIVLALRQLITAIRLRRAPEARADAGTGRGAGQDAGQATGRGAGRDAAEASPEQSHGHYDEPDATRHSPDVPVAEAESLVLAYGRSTALDASTFSVPQGRVTTIIGPNGSGKSTLLHALAGLVPPRAGRLRVLGGRPNSAWKTVAYVMQSVDVPAGIPITVREVVAMGRYSHLGWFRPAARADRARVRWAMHELGIEDLAKRHLSELSGGQRQRVLVAQALAQDHTVLLLDEPLTGLDIVSARAIDHIVHSEQEHDHTVVMTTHDLEEARASDHVLLVSGRVLASGPPDEVLSRRNLEVAYGLGALHGESDEVPEVLPDPAEHDPA